MVSTRRLKMAGMALAVGLAVVALSMLGVRCVHPKERRLHGACVRRCCRCFFHGTSRVPALH
jgi:hypothetical protein